MRISGPKEKVVPALFLCLMLLVILPGCWVYSVNSLYESRLFAPHDRDIVFDPDLTGTWRISSEDCVVTLVVTAPEEPQYQLKQKGEGADCEGDKEESRFQAKLVKLGSHTFLDVSPKPEEVCNSCLAAHQIFLVTVSKNTLDLTPIDSGWLKDAVEKNKINVATVVGNTDILTGSSKELKEFCRKYADDKTVFKPFPFLSFKRS